MLQYVSSWATARMGQGSPCSTWTGVWEVLPLVLRERMAGQISSALLSVSSFPIWSGFELLQIRENGDTHQEVSIILKLYYKFIFFKYSKLLYYLCLTYGIRGTWDFFKKWQLRCPHMSGVLGLNRHPMYWEAFSKAQRLVKGAVWKQPNFRQEAMLAEGWAAGYQSCTARCWGTSRAEPWASALCRPTTL